MFFDVHDMNTQDGYRVGSEPEWEGREKELLDEAVVGVPTDFPTIFEALDAVGATSDEVASIRRKLATWT